MQISPDQLLTTPASRLALALAWSGATNKPTVPVRKRARWAFTHTMKTSSKFLLATTAPSRRVRARLAAPLPAGSDALILALPGVRSRMVAQARALVCELVPLMNKAGVSQNAVADQLGIQRSSLSSWLKAYRAGGLEALVPKSGGRGGHRDKDLILLSLLK